MINDIRKKTISARTKPDRPKRIQKLKKVLLKDRRFIAVSDDVRVTVHGLSLRQSPNTQGKMIRKMGKGESGRVIGGPTRVDGFIWWQLKLIDGETGWATEKKVLAALESSETRVQMLRAVPRSGSSLQTVVPDKKLNLVSDPPNFNTLQSFLDRYSRTYESKDLNAFSALFTPDATENDKQFRKLWPLYRKTFQIIDRIDYKIQLKDHTIELHTQTIHIRGRFDLKWRTVSDNKLHKSSGRIEMVLYRDQGKKLLVKRLKYRYRS